MRPPPDLVQGEAEYEVEAVINHRHQGRNRALQYLLKWKGYLDADNTWEPADQVHAPLLINQYHKRHPLIRPATHKRTTIRTVEWQPPSSLPQPHNYFFINLLYQPYIEMANRLIRVEDMASIAATTTIDSVERKGQSLSRRNPTSPTHTAPPYPSARTTTKKSQDWLQPQAPPSRHAPQQWSLRPLEKPMATCSSRTPKISPPPSTSSKSGWTQTQDRALKAENRLEELLSNKENEPPACNHSEPPPTQQQHRYLRPARVRGRVPRRFRGEHRPRQPGSTSPMTTGTNRSPNLYDSSKGANPHAEGTRGQGFPIFLHHLYAPADYEDTDLPLAQLPIWFTATLSCHSSMYNVVLRAALEHNNWGICADLLRYRQAEDQIGIWEARVEEALQRVERAREERVQTRYRFEATRAHRHFANLECTNKPEDWQYDDDPGMVLPLRQLAR
jgi:hypothetical protein